ncbi:hypothetical protein C8F04DRAFT_1189559 [Mycena alexandri]|uniref:Uncharacterized protein n=1 Tax=Mycena alexandri TaxID=1745969 RepID=A0AAD6SJU4_9AGAR|nr:hypothetical protein C8F04DRAFT_1189559 [Mycena alexandri]
MEIDPHAYYATMCKQGANSDTNFVVAQPAERRRIFTGAVPAEWRLGRDPVVYSEMNPICGRRVRGRGSGRYCIGDETMLSRQVPRPKSSTLCLGLSENPPTPTQQDDIFFTDSPLSFVPSTPSPDGCGVHVPSTSCNATELRNPVLLPGCPTPDSTELSSSNAAMRCFPSVHSQDRNCQIARQFRLPQGHLQPGTSSQFQQPIVDVLPMNKVVGLVRSEVVGEHSATLIGTIHSQANLDLNLSPIGLLEPLMVEWNSQALT